MISEALELRLHGGRVSHSWCMCVVGHGYGWFDGGDGWYTCVTKPGVLSHVGGLQNPFPVRGDTLMTPDYTAVQVRSFG